MFAFHWYSTVEARSGMNEHRLRRVDSLPRRQHEDARYARIAELLRIRPRTLVYIAEYLGLHTLDARELMSGMVALGLAKEIRPYLYKSA